MSGEAPQLYQELWISFASLLRAYAAAASMALPGGGIEIVDRESCGLKLLTASKAMTVDFDARSGTGRWSVEPLDNKTTARSGSFTMDESGRVNLDGNTSGMLVEMDEAAEVLTGRIL